MSSDFPLFIILLPPRLVFLDYYFHILKNIFIERFLLSLETHLPQSLHYHFFKISLEHKTIWFHWKMLLELMRKTFLVPHLIFFLLQRTSIVINERKIILKLPLKEKTISAAAVWLFLIDIALQCQFMISQLQSICKFWLKLFF